MMYDSLGVAILLIILGWLFGLLQPAISEAIRRRREAREVSPALYIELDEIRHKVAMAVFFLQMRFGTVDRNFLKWAHQQVSSYGGTAPKDVISRILEEQSDLSDQEISDIAAKFKANPESGVNLKKYAAPLIDSRIPTFWQMRPRAQRALLQVKAHLDLFNDQVDLAEYYFRLTFEQLTPENHQRVRTNLQGCYENLIERGRILITHIQAALAELKCDLSNLSKVQDG